MLIKYMLETDYNATKTMNITKLIHLLNGTVIRKNMYSREYYYTLFSRRFNDDKKLYDTYHRIYNEK